MNISLEKSELKKSQRTVDLSFHMGLSGTLWDSVFEGFSSEMVLASRFEGKTSNT